MARSTEPHLVGVLLAAGEARRFGSPKQLALLDGMPLVRRSAQAILDTGLPLIVVTGAHADLVGEALNDLALTLCHNAHWQDGMGTSIARAIATLDGDGSVDGVLIALGDQPLVGAAQLGSLLAAHARAPGGITVADHGESLGPPCVFSRRFFTSLAQLRGHEGGRQLIAEQRAAVRRVPMPQAAVDIDTVAQYHALPGAQRS